MFKKKSPFLPDLVKEFPLLDVDLRGLDALSHSGLSVYEDTKCVYVEADLPGLKAEEIDITLDKGVLWIHGERKDEEKGKKYYKKSSSAFSYQVLIPGTIDENKEPEATYKEGVMKIAFKKSEGKQGKKIRAK